jgi:hypothetical protein
LLIESGLMGPFGFFSQLAGVTVVQHCQEVFNFCCSAA